MSTEDRNGKPPGGDRVRHTDKFYRQERDTIEHALKSGLTVAQLTHLVGGVPVPNVTLPPGLDQITKYDVSVNPLSIDNPKAMIHTFGPSAIAVHTHYVPGDKKFNTFVFFRESHQDDSTKVKLWMGQAAWEERAVGPVAYELELSGDTVQVSGANNEFWERMRALADKVGGVVPSQEPLLPGVGELIRGNLTVGSATPASPTNPFMRFQTIARQMT